MASNCLLCNLLIKRTEKYLACNKCKNNTNYVCTSLSSKELGKIDQKSWGCNFCCLFDNVDKSSNILKTLDQTCDNQKSLLERLPSSEGKINY